MPQAFGASAPAGRDFQHEVENLTPDFLHAALAVGNRAGVDVHIVRHSPVRVSVCGNLDHRNGRKANRAAAPGGERYQVAASCGKTRERDGVVAWSVHEGEARGGHGFGVVEDFYEGRRAAFGNGSQRLFNNVGQTVSLVSKTKIIIKTATIETINIALIFLNKTDQAFRHVAIAGALHQQMLGAEDLGGLC